MSASANIIIVGGGIVGLSVAVGLLDRGHDVLVIDGPDCDARASQGNFGLAWLQGKGANFPAYAHWSHEAVTAWPDFAGRLKELTGVDVGLVQDGGYEFFTNATELAEYSEDLRRQARALGNRFSFELLTGDELRHRLPGIGAAVVGATYCPLDGHLNPLRLHTALQRAVSLLGGSIVRERTVTDVTQQQNGFLVTCADELRFEAPRIVLCAGLGSSKLGPMLGFRAPIRAQQGELLITERLSTRLPFLSSTIRQVDEGGVQIGGTKDETASDNETTARMTGLAQHAVDVWPALRGVRVVRSWAALRVMTPDGYPVYQQSEDQAGAFLVTCHSGVTLAPLHATRLADWIDDSPAAPDLEVFDERRFALS